MLATLREAADLAQWPRVWTLLASTGVREVAWDVRLESNQIADVLGASVRATLPSLSLPSTVRQLALTLQVLPAGTPLLIPPGLTEIR